MTIRVVMVSGRQFVECRWLLGIGQVDVAELGRDVGVGDDAGAFALIAEVVRRGGWTVVKPSERDRIVAQWEAGRVARSV
jgi:hypothetical protein